MTEPLLKIQGLVKSYQALRPLRVESLAIDAGAVVSLIGLDAQAAEMFVGLITGAVLPDAGDVHLFGQSTRDVPDSDAWLEMLDGVGLVTDRAVLIAKFSVEQNIAIPFTLQVDPIGDELRAQVGSLAHEVGIARSDLAVAVAQAPAEVVARVRWARALALNPRLLVAEHPSATIPRERVKGFATDLARVARARRLAVLALTADDLFATSLGGDVLVHQPATGILRGRGVWRRIFR